MAARLVRRPRQRGVLAARRGVPVDAGPKTDYFDSLLPRGRRDGAEHERDDRRRGVWTGRCTQCCCPSSATTRKGRSISITCCTAPTDCCARPARLTTMPPTWRRRSTGGYRTPAAVAASSARSCGPARRTCRPPLGSSTSLELLVAAPAPTPAPEPEWARVIRPFLRPFADAAAERVRRIKEEHRKVRQERLEEHRRARRQTSGASAPPVARKPPSRNPDQPVHTSTSGRPRLATAA